MTKSALREEAVKLRKQHMSLQTIAQTLRISKGTASVWLKGLPLPDSILAERKGRGLKNLIREPKQPPVTTYNHLSATKKGKAAELIFITACLLANLDCYIPVTEDGRVDVIIGDRFIKVQIKIVGGNSRAIQVRKTNHSGKTTKIYLYKPNEIDFFIGVDLETRDIYVVPQEIWTRYTSNISVSVLKQFKNDLSLVVEFRGGIEPP